MRSYSKEQLGKLENKTLKFLAVGRPLCRENSIQKVSNTIANLWGVTPILYPRGAVLNVIRRVWGAAVRTACSGKFCDRGRS